MPEQDTHSVPRSSSLVADAAPLGAAGQHKALAEVGLGLVHVGHGHGEFRVGNAIEVDNILVRVQIKISYEAVETEW